MGIFTKQEGLFPVLGKIVFDFRNRWVHSTFHITAVRIGAVIKESLIMHQSGGIQAAKTFCHLMNDRSTEAFISAGENQDGGMVFVPLPHIFNSLYKHGLPFFFILGKHIVYIFCKGIGVPAAVGFHITLIHYIKAVLIRQTVEGGIVGIMRGSKGIDIVSLHGLDILLHLRNTYCSPG